MSTSEERGGVEVADTADALKARVAKVESAPARRTRSDEAANILAEMWIQLFQSGGCVCVEEVVKSRV
jgi:hypothetical protein